MIQIILEVRFRAATLAMFVALGLTTLMSSPQRAGAETLTVNGSGTLLHGVDSPHALSSHTGALTMASFDVVTPATVPHAISGNVSIPSFRASSAEGNVASPVGAGSWANADSAHGSLLAQHQAPTFDSDVTPVPESSTWLTALLAVGAIVYLQRHRFLRRKSPLQTT